MRRASNDIIGIKISNIPNVWIIAVMPICQQNHRTTGIGVYFALYNHLVIQMFRNIQTISCVSEDQSDAITEEFDYFMLIFVYTEYNKVLK